MLQCLLVVWASPASLLGCLVGGVGLISGGRVQRSGRVLEFHGGLVKSFLERCPNEPMAMTLGHTVLGLNAVAHDMTRAHELIHVQQYERWGPFFLPAYLGCSLVLWIRGLDPYRDNPFEREAFEKTG